MRVHDGQLSLLEVGDEPPKHRPRPKPEPSTRQQTTERDTPPPANAVESTVGLLTTAQAAKRLHVHPRTVQRLVERGQLAAVHLGGAVRFDPHDVDVLIADNKERHVTATTPQAERPRARRGARVSFADRLRSDRHEHRAAHA